MVIFHILNRDFMDILRKPIAIVPISTTPQEKSPNTTNSTVSTSKGIEDIDITYYELINDTRYHYEFRFAHNSNTTNNDTRLMILLNGSVRTCVDYWDFAVGRRILTTLRSFHFSILVICSKKRTYDIEAPVQKNADVKWIYNSLQKWINDVYYKHFQHYPRLYIHGISRGSRIAALLCRVLPIQQQILTIYPGDQHGMLTRSHYPVDLQQRLQLDPTFANWFYFDFCYKKSKSNINELCPFHNDRYNYQPVPPTYFIHLQNDRLYQLSQYTSLINQIHQDAFALGGKLLNDTEAVKLYVMPPSNATPTYMQQKYDTWYSKSHASVIFYEHYVNRSFYNSFNNTRQTCQCLPTDFRYYQLYPNITQTWSKQRQDEYQDYANDIEQHIHSFCEDVCGDLHTDHAMSSRHLDKALEWLNRIDSLRHSLFIQDYLTRSLRIWMYNKTSIVTTNDTYFSSKQPDYVDILAKYRMYSPEYFIQDYFEQLKTSSTFSSRHNLQWTDNPLLADYFIIPCDLTYYYFYPDVNTMTITDFYRLVDKLNIEYFETLMSNVRTNFPYWTMANHADQMGANHILTILAGRNMGIFYNQTQTMLKNVIQIVFTGIRQDMLPRDALPITDFRGIPIIYRHGYDIVVPPFTRLIPNSSHSFDVNAVAKNKKHLLFFAGTLGNTITSTSARPLLRILSVDIEENSKYNRTMKVEGKEYDTLTVIDGHQEPNEYVNSIHSSVFSLCPEGYFPWSPRLYDAIQLGAIPLLLVDNIVLPFERFIDWSSFSAKINVSNIKNMIDLVQRIDNFTQYMTRKLINAQPYADAFRWPYSAVGENGQRKHVFLPDEDKNGTWKNAFHYISMELRCRRLEQFYGLTSDSFSRQSIDAQRQACTAHPSICPCHDPKRSVALRQYL